MHDRFFVEPTHNQSASLDGLMTKAERELAALFTAVTELFGSEPARLSGRKLVGRTALIGWLAGLRNCDWRRVTVAVLSRLAARGERIETSSLNALQSRENIDNAS